MAEFDGVGPRLRDVSNLGPFSSIWVELVRSVSESEPSSTQLRCVRVSWENEVPAVSEHSPDWSEQIVYLYCYFKLKSILGCFAFAYFYLGLRLISSMSHLGLDETEVRHRGHPSLEVSRHFAFSSIIYFFQSLPVFLSYKFYFSRLTWLTQLRCVRTALFSTTLRSITRGIIFK